MWVKMQADPDRQQDYEDKPKRRSVFSAGAAGGAKLLSNLRLKQAEADSDAVGDPQLDAALTDKLPPESQPKPFPWAWLIKLTTGLVLLVVIFSYFDLHDVARRIGSADPVILSTAVVLTFGQNLVFAVRWRYLAACAGANLPTYQAFLGNLELAFLSQLVPSVVASDAFRVIRTQRAGLTLTQSFVSVFLDRLIGLSTIVFVAPWTMLLAPKALSGNASYAMVGLGVLFAAALAILYFMAPILSTISSTSRVVGVVISTSSAFRTLVHSARFASVAVVASILGYAIAALAIKLVAAGISVPLDFLEAMPALCLMTLAVLLPLSIGGWGVREGAALVALQFFAVPPTEALTISILYGFCGTAVGLVGGIVWMFSGNRAAAGQP